MVENSEDIQEIKPFLRWAGGKRWLVRQLSERLNALSFNNYYEPFLGGGSVFFNLPTTKKAFLSDLNGDLIETYIVVRDHVERLIDELKKYRNSERFYYAVRDRSPQNKVEKAARFIYLNQTSFNGIYRVNLEGVYNVPYGYRKKNFLEIDNLRNVSAKLKRASLTTRDFEAAIDGARRNDLFFLDPPYTVSHNHNGFIKYNQNLFSLDDQLRLAECVERIKKKDALYILSNAAHKTIDKIFGSVDKKIEIKRASLIGGLKANRGDVSEYLFTNIGVLKTLKKE
ncbi:MAG TPA: Dam family site-specific DNA-(adenine-N6)-methyltransferase [Cyclobacteriaceae bacterium]|nr:Dam family site-specific DNA-(adenine-N6)-methyltransferase [Cyclobacteriaceae bacterium]